MTTRSARAARAAAVLDARVDGDAHQPDRPRWDCRCCEQPWPCSPAKVRLGEAYAGDRLGLAIYMGGLYDQALAELQLSAAPDVFTRFVAWTR